MNSLIIEDQYLLEDDCQRRMKDYNKFRNIQDNCRIDEDTTALYSPSFLLKTNHFIGFVYKNKERFKIFDYYSIRSGNEIFPAFTSKILNVTNVTLGFRDGSE